MNDQEKAKAGRPVSYLALRHSLRTGDVVLFDSPGPISGVIKLMTRSRWSHVGMILRLEVYASSLVLLWESTMLSGVKDIESGSVRNGVQLVPFAARLATTKAVVAVRQRRMPTSTKEMERLMAFRDTVRGRPYERDAGELFRSAYEGPFGLNVEDLSSLFCSELVAEAFQRMDVAPADLPSNEYTPADFSQASRIEWVRKQFAPERIIGYP